MKKFMTILTLGALGTALVLRSLFRRKNVLHFVEDEDTSLKNFGAFPVEISEDQFEGLFV